MRNAHQLTEETGETAGGHSASQRFKGSPSVATTLDVMHDPVQEDAMK